MEQRKTRSTLPETYEQYLAQKKKIPQQQSVHSKQPKLSILEPNRKTEKYEKQSQSGNYSSKGSVKVPSKQDDIEQQVNGSQGDVICQKLVYCEFKKLLDDFENNRFHELKRNIEAQIAKMIQVQPADQFSVNGVLRKLQIQSLQNIDAIGEQLAAPLGRRNLQTLDKMLGFNKFFAILNLDKRHRIYNQCQFVHYQSGDTIYSEGETDDHMYVIVNGCVKQVERKPTTYHEKVTVNFVSHYQGSNFGESQLLAQTEKTLRNHSAVAASQCYLIRIENMFYRQLILNSAGDDFQLKLASLQQCILFRDISKVVLTPLLSTMEKHNVPYGHVLVRQGDPVNRLYFVADGSVEVVFMERNRRSIRHLNIETKPPNFVTRGTSQQGTRARVQSELRPTTHHLSRGRTQSKGKQTTLTGNDRNSLVAQTTNGFQRSQSHLNKQQASNIESQILINSRMNTTGQIKNQQSRVGANTAVAAQIPEYSIAANFYCPESQLVQKEFIYGKKKIIGDQVEFNQFLVFTEMRIGDFFGGKSKANKGEIKNNIKYMNIPPLWIIIYKMGYFTPFP